MAGYVLCQDLNTEGGNPPIPAEQDVLEDWCGDVRNRFTSLDVIPLAPSPAGADGLRAVFGSECSNFSGELYVNGFGGADATQHAEIVLQSDRTYNLTGKQVFFRVSPFGTPVSFESFEFFTPGSGPFWNAFITQDREFDFYGNDIEFIVGGGSSSGSSSVEYSPVDHAWIRFWHDDTANEMGIDTSPFCGNWTNRHTRAATVRPSNVAIGYSGEAYPEGEALIQTYGARWGAINVADYP